MDALIENRTEVVELIDRTLISRFASRLKSISFIKVEIVSPDADARTLVAYAVVKLTIKPVLIGDRPSGYETQIVIDPHKNDRNDRRLPFIQLDDEWVIDPRWPVETFDFYEVSFELVKPELLNGLIVQLSLQVHG